ncbi:tetratricopeptide repeat protein [candidate division KSB1 bacterium]|nr:tetratricopeptide repeat protein [candidate division KSB1 bacterium]NIR72161.1 tetratricopeptide repeat protein [candidate division KSB1 bacterium]NIS26626.1 tetratricopeptide repeat protein [candidate division KSB1 bacterium]NIT73394.1 tetratricopeptide repeat protein [candidate division KSB1 bacterium]NIU27242.1 tetratricopeptide repeat protein [candidate division KSB1 bacterium]
MVTVSVRRESKMGLFLTSLVFLFALYLGCGASRQTSTYEGEEVDLDELLGEEEAAAQGRDSEEAEVLRLLGITPAESEGQQSDFETVSQDQDDSTLEKEVDQLQDELTEKDREISQLRAELTQKESKISELENRSRTASRPRAPMRTSSASNGPSPEFRSNYQNALNQFRSRNYQGALTLFRDLLQSDSNNSLSDNCQYWIGECYYGMGNFNQAIAEFEKVFSFPNSNKTDDAQLMLGVCYLKLGDKQQARAELDRLLSTYPESEYIPVAQRYLARL